MSTEFTASQDTAGDPVFGDQYFKEVQEDIWKHESKKTMTSILAIGGILLASDLIGLSMANAMNGTTISYILVVPLIYAGLGFFAKLKPMISMILAATLFILIIILNIYLFGAGSILSGLLIKAIVIYFMISGFKHARDAESAKKNLSIVQ